MSETARRVAIGLAGIISALGLAVAFSIATAQPRPAPSGGTIPSTRPSDAPVDPDVRAFRGFSILPGEPAEPPGVSLQSRLWSIDGRWWGALVEPASRETRIHELSPGGEAWTDTGTLLDERPGAMVDAVWDGDRLFVASAVPGRSSHDSLRVAGYVRDEAGRFSLAPNFPVVLTEAGTEASSIARDSTGRVWAAWAADGKVTVAHSAADEAVWEAPAPFDDPAASVGSGDVAALVAFGGDRLGLVWTTRANDAVHFASRADSDPPDRWSGVEIAFDGEPLAEAAISAAAGQDGTVVVALETAVADAPDAGQGDPGSAVLVRAADGTWRSTLFGRVEDRLGGPVVAVDPATGGIHVFAVSPRHGGAVHLKSAELGRLEFPAGRGSTLIADPSQPDIAFLTSAKHPPPLADGIVVLGFDETSGFYWHAIVAAPGAPSATPSPPASGSAQPSAGAASPPPGTLLVNDDFEPWPIDGPIAGGWELTPATARGSLTAAADIRPGTLALLRPAGADSVRACRDFATTASGELVAEVRISVDAVGPADAVITSLRDRGDEAVSVRFGQGGTFVYYAGETRVRTTAPLAPGSWYRSTVVVDVAGRTYDWRLRTDEGSVVVDVRDVPFREATAVQVSQLCVGSSAGAAGVGTRFDDVRVSR